MKTSSGFKVRAMALVLGVLLASVTVAGSIQGGQGGRRQGGPGQGAPGQGGPGQGGPGMGGQRGPGMGMRQGPQSLMFLVGRPGVAQEIGLTEQQAQAIGTAMEGFQPLAPPQGGQRPDREAMRKQMEEMMAQLDTKLAEILSPAQMRRLEEISIQTRGLTAALDPKVQAKLNLSDQQRQALIALANPPRGAGGGPGRPGGPGNGGQGGPPPPPPGDGGAGPAGPGRPGGQGARGQANPRRAMLEKQIAEILTDAQEAKLKELGGKPFVAPRRAPGAAGAPGRPGGGPGRPGGGGEQAVIDGLTS